MSDVFKTEAEYEAMPIEELSEIKDFDLKLILQRVFGLDSIVYFIDKVQKLRYISQPDQRPVVLAEGEEKRGRHRELNKENRIRPRGTNAERLEEETKDRSYRFVGSTRHEEAVQDHLTGKSIRVAYTIEDLVDGSQFEVSRGTCRWLEEKGQLEDFEVTKGRQSVAHAAGQKTAADLLGGATKPTPQVIEKQLGVPEENAPAIEDDELDAILNSLPS